MLYPELCDLPMEGGYVTQLWRTRSPEDTRRACEAEEHEGKSPITWDDGVVAGWC